MSDHSPFSVCLRTGKPQLDEDLQTEHNLTPSKKVIWNDVCKKKFTETMSQPNRKQKLLSFIETKFMDPNIALRRLCNLVTQQNYHV